MFLLKGSEMSDKKIAKIPVSFAKALGKELQKGEGDRYLPYDTGEECRPIDFKWIGVILKKGGFYGFDPKTGKPLGDLENKHRCSVKDKDNRPGIPLAKFIKDAVKLSHEQGYLTMQDLANLANIVQVNMGSGTKNFRKFLCNLFDAQRAVTVSQGRGTGPEADIDCNVTAEDIEAFFADDESENEMLEFLGLDTQE